MFNFSLYLILVIFIILVFRFGLSIGDKINYNKYCEPLKCRECNSVYSHFQVYDYKNKCLVCNAQGDFENCGDSNIPGSKTYDKYFYDDYLKSHFAVSSFFIIRLIQCRFNSKK